MTDFKSFYDKLRASVKENLPKTELDERKAEQFYILCDCLIEQNKKINLTAITDIDSIIVKHIVDSVAVIDYIPENSRVIDVGCGGGFPTLPIAIMRADVHITALDSTAKKLNFVECCSEKCGLSNVETLNIRAEEASKLEQYRESYDIAVSRAVARLNILSELCIPFVKIGGEMLALKGNSSKEEFEEAKNAFFKLGASKTELILYSVKFGQESLERGIVRTKKTASTSAKYPRQFSKIKKAPL